MGRKRVVCVHKRGIIARIVRIRAIIVRIHTNSPRVSLQGIFFDFRRGMAMCACEEERSCVCVKERRWGVEEGAGVCKRERASVCEGDERAL